MCCRAITLQQGRRRRRRRREEVGEEQEYNTQNRAIDMITIAAEKYGPSSGST